MLAQYQHLRHRAKYSIIQTNYNTEYRATARHWLVKVYNKPFLTKKEIKSLPHSSHGSVKFLLIDIKIFYLSAELAELASQAWVVARPRSDVLIIARHFLRNFITDISGWLGGCIYITREQRVMLDQISWKLFPSRDGRDWPNIISVVGGEKVGGLHHSATGGNYSFLTSQLENIQTTNTDTASIFPHHTRAGGTSQTENIYNSPRIICTIEGIWHQTYGSSIKTIITFYIFSCSP